MKRIFNRAYLALAVGYVFAWALWAISNIGEVGDCTRGVTWAGAWFFVSVMAAAAILGWLAGKEQE